MLFSIFLLRYLRKVNSSPIVLNRLNKTLILWYKQPKQTTMKTLKFKPFLLFVGISFALMSCGGEATEGGEEGGSEESVMTTEEFIAEANELGKEAFDEKYPSDSEITLEGEVRAPATWDDKVAAKFGTGLNDLPLTADFMFDANGGKDATKDKVKGGEVVRFTGKVVGSFFDGDTFKRCSFSDCIAQ